MPGYESADSVCSVLASVKGGTGFKRHGFSAGSRSSNCVGVAFGIVRTMFGGSNRCRFNPVDVEAPGDLVRFLVASVFAGLLLCVYSFSLLRPSWPFTPPFPCHPSLLTFLANRLCQPSFGDLPLLTIPILLYFLAIPSVASSLLGCTSSFGPSTPQLLPISSLSDFPSVLTRVRHPFLIPTDWWPSLPVFTPSTHWWPALRL